MTTVGQHITPQSQFEVVTPEIAAQILNAAGPNRPLSEKLVNAYALEMKNGRWHQTGEPIKLDKHGHLIDGQHRLNAIVRSQSTLNLLVVRGLDFESQDLMDSGRKRSLGDQLAMRGYTSTNSLAAAIGIAYVWQQHGRVKNAAERIPLPLLFDWFSDNHEIVESVRIAMPLKHGAARFPVGLGAAIHFTMAKLSPSDADFFWEVFRKGRQVSGTESIIVFRERMINAVHEKASRGSTMDNERRAAFAILAWNHWLRGNAITKLQWRPHKGEAFPKLIDPNEL